MKRILVLIIFLSSLNFGIAQSIDEQKNGYVFSCEVGVGLTKFAVSGFVTEDYPATVLRFGGKVSKTIFGNRLQLETGLGLFYRSKSKSPLKNEIYYHGKGALLPRLDEAATEEHYAFEIPLTLNYLIRGGRSIGCGLKLRQWTPNNKQVDLLVAQTELGALVNINQRLLSNFDVGLELFTGFKDFYHGQVMSSSGNGDVIVRNQSALLTFAYIF